jgi:hypothetical protein
MIATRVMPALYLTRRVASITPVTTRQPTLPGPCNREAKNSPRTHHNHRQRAVSESGTTSPRGSTHTGT